MSRPKSTNHVELSAIFHQMQSQMMAHFAANQILDHPTTCGAVTEQQWLQFFREYLPQRYCASSAFIVDADGRRSRQIDIAIYDRLYSPLLFPHPSGLHIPAESVYAIFEVKQELTSKCVRDAGVKAESVRRLRRTSVPVLAAGAPMPAIKLHPILCGVLAPRAIWPDFEKSLPLALARLAPVARLDLGCVLHKAAFEVLPARASARNCGAGSQPAADSQSAHRRFPLMSTVRFSTQREALVFFMLRLLDRLRAIGTAPAADLMAYARSLDSFARR
jgi:hypothetical protein